MAPRAIAFVVAAIALTGLAALLWSYAGEPEEVRKGRLLYADHCAACHGANLEGQPDWQTRLPDGLMPAPPHDVTGHTWHHSDNELLIIVRDGMAGLVPGQPSAMPAFGALLDEAEIGAVLAYIKSTWPRQAREYQALQTSARDPRP